jgi:hypothetical protein
MDLGVDGEGGRVDRLVPLDHLAVVVDQIRSDTRM